MQAQIQQSMGTYQNLGISAHSGFWEANSAILASAQAHRVDSLPPPNTSMIQAPVQQPKRTSLAPKPVAKAKAKQIINLTPDYEFQYKLKRLAETDGLDQLIFMK